MKKLYYIVIVLALTSQLHADQFLRFSNADYDITQHRTEVYTSTGQIATAEAGYIATYWFGLAGEDLKAYGASTFMTALNPETQTLWQTGVFDWYTSASPWKGAYDGRIDSTGSVGILSDTAYVFEVRIWKYQDDPTTYLALTNELKTWTYDDIESAWAALEGTNVERGVLSAERMSTSTGQFENSYFYQWNEPSLTLSTGNIPEPSTYALLAGGGILGMFTRRRRKP